MKQRDATDLIKGAFLHKVKSSTWADLGCGTGTFTGALASLLTDNSKIYAVDRESQQLDVASGGKTAIQFVKLNFVDEILPFHNLDGILMANSLHFVKDRSGFIKQIKNHLKPDGEMIIVEYDRLKPTPWVPYPVSFDNLFEIFTAHGFTNIEKIGERNSIFGKEKMYACWIRV